MNQVHPDLEANLLASEANLSLDPRPLQAFPNLQGQRRQQNRQRRAQVLTRWEFSIRYNIILAACSLAKFAGCLTVMAIAVCPMDIKVVWTLFNTGLELILSLLFIMRVINILRLNRVIALIQEHNNQIRQRGRNNARRQAGAANQNGAGQQEQLRNSIIQRNNSLAIKILRNFFNLRWASDVFKGLWAVLIIWGLIVYGIGPNAQCDSSYLNTLMLVLILLGIISLALPVILSSCMCLCRPVVVLGLMLIFGRPRQRPPAPEVDISNLRVIKYSPELPGETECVICRVEYVIGEKVVQLNCSPMHHFHEECGKKWLRVSGQCPMCRADVNEEQEEANE